MMSETIAAIATAPGEAGIGIVRTSGDRSIEILERIFKPKRGIEVIDIPSRRVTYGYILDSEGKEIDEVLVIIMRKPYSYTTEDVVEIHCHGGIVPVRRIMEQVLKAGAVLAEPGEFTKRAFLNGRIDLTQAEAVIDVITSKTEMGLNAAIGQLEGNISKEIHSIMDMIISAIAHIEASIDFPEHDIEEVTAENIRKIMIDVKTRLNELTDTFEEGKIVRDGLVTAIVGRPNVGKSSLLNVLVEENKAIVTEIPGTTRDIIEEFLNIGGILIKLVDTAGIRETEDVVEKIGVERTRKAIDEAELVIMVIDFSDDLQQEDREIIEMLKNKKVIVAANKIDLGSKADVDYLIESFGENKIIKMSAKEEIGINQLKDTIKELVFQGNVSINRNRMITNIRHKDLLEKAKESAARALRAIEDEIPVDLLSVDIRDAWTYLGKITGDTVEEDIIHEIFSKFCVGK